MRLLFVVHRYGPDLGGGAEQFCREYATRLAARGHAVEVLTSCASRYVDWGNVYEPGTATHDGVDVHRLPVAAPREDRVFTPLNTRVGTADPPVARVLEESWMRQQGPRLPGLRRWLTEQAGRFDAVIFVPYLYYPTWAGISAAAARTTAVLHPCAHDEPALRAGIFVPVFRAADAFGFLAPEEEDLVRATFRLERPSFVGGVGVDADRTPGDREAAAFRAAWGLGRDPYLLTLGRVDPSKGSLDAFDAFTTYKRRNGGPLRLVFAGDAARPLPSHPDVVCTGYLSDDMKAEALAGAVGLLHPSAYESFSIVLTEAWAYAKPAVVNAASAVLAGHARRSGAAFAYRGYREFEAALDLLQEDPALASRLGERGRSYVEQNYRWESLLDGYESFLGRLTRDRPRVRAR